MYENPVEMLNPDWQKQLETEGFLVVDLLDEAELETLRNYYADFFSQVEPNGLWNALLRSPTEQMSRVWDQLLPFAEAVQKKLFRNRRIVIINFMDKFPGTGRMEEHLDLSYSDERKHPFYFIWCPLVDVTPEKGALILYPQSHHAVPYPRAFAAPPHFIYPYDTTAQILALKRAYQPLTVPLRAGQVLIYHNALLHGSEANQTQAQRPVFTLGTLPQSAPFLNYFWTPEGGYERAEVIRPFHQSFVVGQRMEYPYVPCGSGGWE